MLKNIKYSIAFLVLLLSLSSNISAFQNSDIKFGTSNLSGKILTSNSQNYMDRMVKITYSLPITAKIAQYSVKIDSVGTFSINLPTELSATRAIITFSGSPYQVMMLPIVSEEDTKMEITLNSEGNIDNVTVNNYRNSYDVLNSYKLFSDILSFRLEGERVATFDKPPISFIDEIKKTTAARLTVADRDKLISEEIRELTKLDFNHYAYNLLAFDYEVEMLRNFKNMGGDLDNIPVFNKVDKSYYKFLKELNFNDSKFLQSNFLYEIQNKILTDSYLSIPDIGETSVKKWINDVSMNIGDLIGFKEGLYYEVLAANSYSIQLNNEYRELSSKQIKHIKDFWGEKEIAKILLRRNTEVKEIGKKIKPVNKINVSKIAPNQIIETILSANKGKVVLIDLWATWCSPCLDAMDRFKVTKTEYLNQKIEFVYLSNSSSPEKLWNQKITGIGGDQYYLSDAQWNYVMEQFDFEAIPSYLLFDKEGKLVNKFTAFPENEVIKKMLDTLLN